MLRNVAVGIDTSPGSQVPLRQALELATACAARLHLLGALEDAAGGEEAPLGAPQGPFLLSAPQGPVLDVSLPGEPPEEPPAGLPSHLDRARQACHEEGVPCRVHLHRGEAWPWLEETARLANVLVVGRHAAHGAQGPRWGRTLRRLLQDPEVPLLVCGREVVEGRLGLLLYTPDAAGARALALTAEICAGLNVPLGVIAAAPQRHDAAAALVNARDALYAYQLDCDFTAVEGAPAAALLELSLERHPSLVALPVQPRPLRSFLTHPLCQAALDVPEAAALIVP
jgi:nucleotide-binding universal stress UspA family protein